jgi:hypothetical protein
MLTRREVVTEFFHKRQIRQEQVLEAELPASEQSHPSEDENEKNLENRVAGSVESVRGSVSIM